MATPQGRTTRSPSSSRSPGSVGDRGRGGWNGADRAICITVSAGDSTIGPRGLSRLKGRRALSRGGVGARNRLPEDDLKCLLGNDLRVNVVGREKI